MFSLISGLIFSKLKMYGAILACLAVTGSIAYCSIYNKGKRAGEAKIIKKSEKIRKKRHAKAVKEIEKDLSPLQKNKTYPAPSPNDINEIFDIVREMGVQ